MNTETNSIEAEGKWKIDRLGEKKEKDNGAIEEAEGVGVAEEEEEVTGTENNKENIEVTRETMGNKEEMAIEEIEVATEVDTEGVIGGKMVSVLRETDKEVDKDRMEADIMRNQTWVNK